MRRGRSHPNGISTDSPWARVGGWLEFNQSTGQSRATHMGNSLLSTQVGVRCRVIGVQTLPYLDSLAFHTTSTENRTSRPPPIEPPAHRPLPTPLPRSLNPTMPTIASLSTRRSRRRATPWLGMLLIMACRLGGQAAVSAEPELKSIFPFGCQVGESVEITLTGTGLNQGVLYFSRDGISAEHLEKGQFRVAVSADAAVGDCELWIATAEGLAGPRRFRISRDPVIAEQEDNDRSDDSQAVQIPSVIDGQLGKTADLDWFEFDGKEGQRITITCRSRSLDGSVQPAFTLFGPRNRELLHSSSHNYEPQVVYRLPAHGSYRLLMRERAYRQNDYSIYRLELTTDPLNRTAVENTNLIRPDELFGTIEIEDEREQSRESPQVIELPCRVSGQFIERNDVDWFRFQAKKGQMIHIEAFGERLGQLMDLEATIYDAADKQVTTIADITAPKNAPPSMPLASLDPSTDWKVPADGEYSIAVRDLYSGSVFGTHRVYELIVMLTRPAFFAVAIPGGSKHSRGVFIKRGETSEISVTVVRTGGFSGPVTVHETEAASGLTIEPCNLDDKEITKAIKVTAAKDAVTGFRSLRLVVETQIGSDTQTVPVWNAVQIRPGTTRRIEDLIIYVSE